MKKASIKSIATTVAQILTLAITLALLSSCHTGDTQAEASGTEIPTEQLSQEFLNPPASSRPWVYWINMDGHFDMEGITADLESIKEAGMGGVLYMEVDLGIPRGDVHFMSPQWQEHMKHAIKECERLGLEFSLISGPGWTGSGGPWMEAEQSMQHLLSSSVEVTGPVSFTQALPVPGLRISRFHSNQTPHTQEQIDSWVKDVAVLAFPKCEPSIGDIDEKALYKRDPTTSQMGVKPYLPPLPESEAMGPERIDPGRIIDLSDKLDEQGILQWEVPEGEWTILRLCSRSTGAITRPAPLAGVGLESNKFEKEDLDHHYDTYVGKLMEISGRIPGSARPSTGWNTLQFDSWEMSSQNWSRSFREEFRKRRGYDLWNYLPVLSGRVVESPEISDRFLWDLRQTSQDLILENHAGHFLKRAHEDGFELSIEPYDMNPTTDMLLASVADVPMGEFWTNHFNSAYSIHQASSTGHIYGKKIIAAEAYTSFMTCWSRYPYQMKDQGDWAFSTGINRLVYVQFTHKPWSDVKPGLAFGPHGIYWDRKQTFWPLVGDYHDYISRCQHMLRQGTFVADICYLLPEGAPNVFVPPPSAFKGDPWTPDRKGYNFDGCPPDALMEEAEVRDGKIEFPSGASFHLLVLPDIKAMSPELLRRVEELARDGATIVGSPPLRAPGLNNYPACDREVEELVERIWGGSKVPGEISMRKLGKGSIWWGGTLSQTDAENYDRNPADELAAEEKQNNYAEGLFGHDGTRPGTPYPEYGATSEILIGMDIPENFSAADEIRYSHLRGKHRDIFFVGNRGSDYVESKCRFRTTRGRPMLWDPVSGEIRDLPEFTREKDCTSVALQFESYQSYFIVFEEKAQEDEAKQELRTANRQKGNFPSITMLMEVVGPWTLDFDPAWGGPGEVVYEELDDWTSSPEEGIRYFSGIVDYTTEFTLDAELLSGLAEGKNIYLHLGEVHDMAQVSLNGKELACIWTAPWHVNVSQAIEAGNNTLVIRVANRWPNRLIGDESKSYDGIVDGKLPDWLPEGKERTSGRYTYSTLDCFEPDSPLLPSGLIGPVSLEISE